MNETTVKSNKEVLDQPEIHNKAIRALRHSSEEAWEEICEYRGLLDALDYQKCLLELEKIKNEKLR